MLVVLVRHKQVRLVEAHRALVPPTELSKASQRLVVGDIEDKYSTVITVVKIVVDVLRLSLLFPIPVVKVEKHQTGRSGHFKGVLGGLIFHCGVGVVLSLEMHAIQSLQDGSLAHRGEA